MTTPLLHWPALLLTTCTLLSACEHGVAPVVASVHDYDDFRQTRVAPSLRARLTAAAIYMERHPSGAFYDEVRDWFGKREPVFYEQASGSSEGVQRYLDALPNGPHASDARQRLEAFRVAERSSSGEFLA